MSQLLTLIWLKWKLLRNSLRSPKAVVNKAASLLGMLLALAIALMIAAGLGWASYFLNRRGAAAEIFRQAGVINGNDSIEFIFFSIFSFLYLMWATVPLSIGSNKQFDAGRLLIYPISLKKLFAVDFVSELTTLQSIFALPAILAMVIGAGLASGNMAASLLGGVPIIVFGISLSKWLTTIMSSLVKTKRSRGETIIAVIGGLAALSAALIGQVAPLIVKHARSLKSLRWSPPGAAAVLVIGDTDQLFDYVAAFGLLVFYTIVLIWLTFWIARRSALGEMGGRKRQAVKAADLDATTYSAWQLPLLSPDTSAIVEKELRYAMRNAQLRMMALMPLILIVIRLVRLGNGSGSAAARATPTFGGYGQGLLQTGGVLYVFMVLAGISCNLFAFEEGGMRTFILSPVDRKKILMGKNLTVTLIAMVFSTLLIFINGIVFRDITPVVLLFIVLSFVCFAALFAMFGNFFSIRFPKRMQFGKRLNVSGVAGLFLLPMVLVLVLPPVGAILAGYFARSLTVEYATLAASAALLIGLYFMVVRLQGRSLARRELDIMEAVREPTDT